MAFSNKPLKGKVAIVTGGTKGIGAAIADKLKEHGASVVVCARNPQRSKHTYISADVSNSEEVQNLVNYTIKKYKKIDILVNNAGIFPNNPFSEMTEEQWDKVMDVNLKGIFNCTKAVLPFMTQKRYGKIINISSIAGTREGYAGMVHYCTSKAGVAGFTKAAAVELAEHGINVNAIAPGLIETPGVSDFMDPQQRQAFAKSVPLKRNGKPVDIAELAAFLASDASSYITGQTITCDGGITIV
ncbi:SDR family oxidoreductase [Candidatus Woesearchaeota archaeon]|nr:SDR family oxidoreductase [Candidatus Woesearchaeota archaeon]